MSPRDREVSRPVIAHRRVYEGRVWDVARDEVELASGQRVERDYVEHPGAVAIVAVNEHEEMIMVRQYRHPVRHELWEVPAGLLDVPGEDPLVAARRELYEEADLYADHWEKLVDYFTTPGGSDEKLQVFLARDLRSVPLAQRYERSDEERDMEIAFIPVAQVVQAVLSGGMMNPSTVVGSLAYAQKFLARGVTDT